MFRGCRYSGLWISSTDGRFVRNSGIAASTATGSVVEYQSVTQCEKTGFSVTDLSFLEKRSCRQWINWKIWMERVTLDLFTVAWRVWWWWWKFAADVIQKNQFSLACPSSITITLEEYSLANTVLVPSRGSFKPMIFSKKVHFGLPRCREVALPAHLPNF